MEKLPFTLDECYIKVQKCLDKSDVLISNYKKISYGLQFKISHEQYSSTLRIFNSKKKGTHIDFSQVKPEVFYNNVHRILENCLLGQASFNLEPNSPKASSSKRDSLIGTDESGKGDYFGPLVIAGIFIKKDEEKQLKEMGVQDSKKLNDSRCQSIAKHLKSYPHSVVAIGPEKYNELYQKIANLNKLLAWGHARVIENLLKTTDCKYVLSDQFGDESLIKNALMDKGKAIYLEQRPRAEENIVVASASILARAGFLSYMNKLSGEYNVTIIKGASDKVITQGKELINKYGKDVLKKIAKLHFKTTNKIFEG